ncbi:hypothetical protein BOW53_01070 [Solemya pervernicosa gill symbiont]|uniref:Uncharacterized protein n=1 Tax=Solemya pervernicosa gill symbiont TaxID=642797 RepID=A0A1T2LAT8_9GAMM|nr:hypothetical protein [Solemya pervernicosa gill symbiont]OOZ42201.1 hypothetical protein BOW53_01070 [Solemya pervernicosa gill symbiont]
MGTFTALGLLLLILLVPIKVAGNYFEAERTGFGWCFLAMILASAFMQAGEELTEFGGILSIFLSAAGYSMIMGTTYIKGIAISAFQTISIIVGFSLFAFLGAAKLTVT